VSRTVADEADAARGRGRRDAGSGKSAEFRQALTARGLRWAVGIDATQQVYPTDVELIAPSHGAMGRPPTPPTPTAPRISAKALIEARLAATGQGGPRTVRHLSWRRGTKGLLVAEFAAVRVRVADGPRMAGGKRLPGDAAWLVCERRATGERKYYLTNHPPRTSLL
jgi:SRSO17 transposase